MATETKRGMKWQTAYRNYCFFSYQSTCESISEEGQSKAKVQARHYLALYRKLYAEQSKPF